MTLMFKAQGVPYHQGWAGWKHVVDVLVDGVKIGELIGTGENKSKLEYGFAGDHPITAHLPRFLTDTGVKAAKERVRKAWEKMQ